MWEDVTELCRAAARGLDVHTAMLSTSDFSLHQSMSAVELMDPKMDQCYQMPASSIDNLMHIKVPEALDYRTVVKILQVVVVYEAALVDGASALESTHQCVLLWDGSWGDFPQQTLAQRALLVYCKSLNLSLNRLCRGVADADIFEDEDFQPLSNAKSFPDALLDQRAQVEAEMEAVLKALAAIDGDPAAAELAKLLESRAALHHLYMRFESCVDALLEASRLAKREGVAPNAAVMADAKSQVAQSAQAAMRLLQELGSACPPPDEQQPPAVKTHAEEGDDVQFAFSAALVKMMQNSPIRHVEFKPFPSAVKYLAALCEELVSTSTLVEGWTASAAASTLTLDSLLQTMVACSARRLHVVTRSLLVTSLGLLSLGMDSFVGQSMRAHGLPKALVDWELLVVFVKEVLGPVCTDTLRGLTVNRNKVLIKLDSLLSRWGAVMSDMTEVGSQFLKVTGVNDDRQLWCQYWTLLHTTLLMDLFMGVSVESSLLGNNELDYFYWYWDFICNTRCWAYERLRLLSHDLKISLYELELAQAKAASDGGGGSGGGGGGGKKKGGGKATSSSSAPSSSSAKSLPRPDPPSPPLPSVDETVQRAKGHLCKGVFRLLVVAHQWRLLERKENKYTTWHWRFMQRFRSFQNIHNPPMLSYEEVLRVVGMGQDRGGGGGEGEAGGGGGGGGGDGGGGGRGDGEGGDESLSADGHLWADLDVSRRVLKDASVCFNSARLLLAEVKKAAPSGAGEKMVLDLSAPLFKVSRLAALLLSLS